MARQSLFAAELVLAALILAALLLLLWLFTRRRLLSHEGDVVACGIRPRAVPPWRPALLRMSAGQLQAFPLFGWTTRPAYTWERYTLELSATTPLEEDGRIASVFSGQGDRTVYRVRVSGVEPGGEGMTFDLALAPAQYTAMRYWVESSPPIRRPL